MSFTINKVNFFIHNEKVELDFTIPNNDQLIKISLMLGPNGTGKSYILSKISEIFRDLEQYKLSQSKINYDFSLEYKLDDNKFIVESKNGTLDILKNGNHITNESLEIPSKVLAISFLVHDKFLFRQTAMYDYLGVRQTSNATFTNAIEKKIVSNFLQNATDSAFINKFILLLDFLDLSKAFTLSFQIDLKSLITTNITAKTYQARQNLLIKQRKMEEGDITSEQIEFANHHLRLLKKNKKIIKRKIHFEFDLHTLSGLNKSQLNCIFVLQKLKFISNPVILIQKNHQEYDFEALSSGEKNILFTLSNILAHKQKNCLILLDEPEISLHPSWQVEYMEIMRTILLDSHAHLIIASHSHFLVSDMKPEHSTLHTFVMDGLKKSIEKIAYSTYAWAADVILYKVFHTRSYSNHSIKMDIAKALDLIGKGVNDKETLLKIYQDLEKITFDETDPMNEILKGISQHISSHE